MEMEGSYIHAFQPGSKYLVLDAGGTCEIILILTAYLIIKLFYIN